MDKPKPTTRAVTRPIEAGLQVYCVHCDERVMFRAKVSMKPTQVICNVYADGRWGRVEHYHSTCYEEAGMPHGAPS